MELINPQLTTVAVQLILITTSPTQAEVHVPSQTTYIYLCQIPSISGLAIKEVTKGITSA
jgi:hypothetical protein